MRYRFVIVGVLTFLLVPAAALFSQEEITAGTDVFAPFVSRLRVAVRDPQVRITWRDSVDLDGGHYRIYRHTSEITQETFEAAEEIAIVDPEVETYLDTPLAAGDYYYAVLAENDEGEIYRIFVPFRNKSIRSVSVSDLETEEDLAATIYDIEARVQDNAVFVRFDASRNGRTLRAYRSSLPFTGVADLTDATLIDEFVSSTRRFADYPVPEVDYYYAVFDAALIERGTVTIEPGENTLAVPVRINIGENADITVEVPRATKRREPLPVLQLADGVIGTQTAAISEVPRGARAQVVSSTTREAIESLLAHAPERQPFSPEPVILPEDRAAGREGVEATLSQILANEFSAGRYDRAASLLDNLLDLPLAAEFEQRVRFYRGQALYFDGRHESAFLEFLSASEGELYVHSWVWLEGILSSS